MLACCLLCCASAQAEVSVADDSGQQVTDFSKSLVILTLLPEFNQDLNIFQFTVG